MSYMKNRALETRTCGRADEDARLDRRDGYTSRARQQYTPQRRSREWWEQYNAEQREKSRRIAREMAEKGLTAHGTKLTDADRADLVRAGILDDTAPALAGAERP